MIDKNDYVVLEIDKKIANDLVIKNHYLHRKPNNIKSFGLFKTNSEEILGCIIFGIPASRNLQKGICGDEYKNDVVELVRLWVNDSVPKNGESFLISQGLKKINHKIVVSFADTEAHHIGRIYQATNWIYTGLSASHKDYKFTTNSCKHSRHIPKIEEINDLILKGEMFIVQRSRKHRYVYFNCHPKERTKLLQKLRYPITSYPKTPS